jgi:hypothetical protein
MPDDLLILFKPRIERVEGKKRRSPEVGIVQAERLGGRGASGHPRLEGNTGTGVDPERTVGLSTGALVATSGSSMCARACRRRRGGLRHQLAGNVPHRDA